MKESTINRRIDHFNKAGWKVDYLPASDPDIWHLVSPRGLVFTREQVSLNRCPVCDPADYEAVCIHAETDLQEGKQAIKLGKLFTLRENLELGKILLNHRD